MELTKEEILRMGKDVLAKEAEAILSLERELDESFLRAVYLLLDCKGKAIAIGIGKSGHVGRKMAATLASLGTPAFFVHAGEVVHGDFGMITDQDVLLLISHSGETEELLVLLETLREIGSKIISVTSRKKCRIARQADVALVTGVVEEADPMNLAPTSSSTATLALGDALAITLARLRGFTEEDFARFHPGGSLGRRLTENPEREL